MKSDSIALNYSKLCVSRISASKIYLFVIFMKHKSLNLSTRPKLNFGSYLTFEFTFLSWKQDNFCFYLMEDLSFDRSNNQLGGFFVYFMLLQLKMLEQLFWSCVHYIEKTFNQNHQMICTSRSIEIVPRGGNPFWLMGSLFGWWNLEADPLWLMNSRGGPLLWGCMSMNSKGGPPFGGLYVDEF